VRCRVARERLRRAGQRSRDRIVLHFAACTGTANTASRPQVGCLERVIIARQLASRSPVTRPHASQIGGGVKWLTGAHAQLATKQTKASPSVIRLTGRGPRPRSCQPSLSLRPRSAAGISEPQVWRGRIRGALPEVKHPRFAASSQRQEGTIHVGHGELRIAAAREIARIGAQP
jgi:hypothetical protein